MRWFLVGGVLLVVSVGVAACALKLLVPVAPKAELASGRDPGEILPIGAKAPAFEVPDDKGNIVRLADHAGKDNVVLIFYPGDNTPTCTAQLCAARDDFGRYEQLDAVVYGVNPASRESHAKFASRQNFPFPLLADTEGTLINAYGCRGIGGITKRTVYVIGKDGTILFAERGVPSTDAILASIKG